MAIPPQKLPRILQRKVALSTPWLTLRQKTVDFQNGNPTEEYYSLSISPYIAILAITEDQKVVIVRQYRPAVEKFTYELPAGLVDDGESPEQTCRRELREETGLEAKELTCLGEFDPDTGRMENTQHCFVVKTGDSTAARPTPEAGIEVLFWTVDELYEALRSLKFRHSLHVSVILYADRFHFDGKLFSPR